MWLFHRVLVASMLGLTCCCSAQNSADFFSRPSLFPDGRKLVVELARDGHRSLYSVNVDGSKAARLTTSSQIEEWPAVSPDGQTIVYVAKSTDDAAGQVYSMNADGSNQTRLTNGAPS